MYSILVSCLLCIGQAQAFDKLFDATSFDPQPILVQAKNNSVPIGTVIAWAKEIIPEGWLECNGQAVNETLYPDLHVLMPHTPDYRDRFLQGTGINPVGERIEAGIPNLKGVAGAFYGDLGGNYGLFRTYNVDNVPVGASFIMPRRGQLEFNANRYNPIYKDNVNTVQPPTVVVKYIIKAE